MTGPLSFTEAIPPPRSLPETYDRYHPDVASERAVVASLVEGSDWAALSWPDVVDELISLGRTDIPLARLSEGHVDALRILDQASAQPEPDDLYGVWASRSDGTGVSAAEHHEVPGTR